jgi:hypothetical protein
MSALTNDGSAVDEGLGIGDAAVCVAVAVAGGDDEGDAAAGLRAVAVGVEIATGDDLSVLSARTPMRMATTTAAAPGIVQRRLMDDPSCSGRRCPSTR